jgi:hypothetical protein
VIEQKPISHSFMVTQTAKAGPEMTQEHFQHVLSREPFKGLKAIFDSLSSDRESLCQAVNSTNSYEALLAKLGYRIVSTPQIHVQDCYSRVGPAGGIKKVLPCYDIPTQSSLPTLVNFDSTITTTPKAIAFFNQMFAALKKELSVAQA